MTDTTKKLAFGSPEWVDVARTVLEELVAKHGEIGKSFSVCEAFTDAPPGMAGPDPTTATWHFSIVDKTVTVGEGELSDADMNVSVPYAQALPAARFVYTPEMVAQAERRQPQGGAGGPALPSYLVELHNRLAVVTQ